MKIIYILGSGHCGATLLDLILDSHSQIFGVGEMHAARDDSVCTCGNSGHVCELWKNALGSGAWPVQALFRGKWDYLFGRPPYHYVWAKGSRTPVDNAAFTQWLLNTYHSLLSQTETSIIVDSSKEIERAELISTSPEVEPIIIHIVRDGRGSTWNYINKYKRTFPFFFMWTSINLKTEVLRRRFTALTRGRGKFIYLRFSDLLNEPEKTIRRLCEEIGITYESAMLRWDEGEHHEIDGNRTRFLPGHVIYPDTWRKTMPSWLRIAHTACFGWLNAYYTRFKRSFT